MIGAVKDLVIAVRKQLFWHWTISFGDRFFGDFDVELDCVRVRECLGAIKLSMVRET